MWGTASVAAASVLGAFEAARVFLLAVILGATFAAATGVSSGATDVLLAARRRGGAMVASALELAELPSDGRAACVFASFEMGFEMGFEATVAAVVARAGCALAPRLEDLLAGFAAARAERGGANDTVLIMSKTRHLVTHSVSLIRVMAAV